MGIFSRQKQQNNWFEISENQYHDIYNKYGGSFVTHPITIKTASEIAKIKTKYLGYTDQESQELIAAIPCWDKYFAGSHTYFKKNRLPTPFDLGDSEIILPLAPNHKFSLPLKIEFLSLLHKINVINCKISKKFELCLAKSNFDSVNKLSRKFKYNQRRELRILQNAGGVIKPISELSPAEISAIYQELFITRWGFEPLGINNLPKQLMLLHDFLVGSVLYLNNKPIAIQLVFAIESPDWISASYVNGAYDQTVKEFSPGSVLTYLNTLELDEHAINSNKQLRFCFGKNDAEYKLRWCYTEPLFETT